MSTSPSGDDAAKRSVTGKPRPSAAVISPAAFSGRGSGPKSEAAAVGTPLPQLVTFERLELRAILNLYGRKVAAGEWRDYAIDFSSQKAVFSIYRRASEVPLYRIEKDPALARRQGAFSVITPTGLILKRGSDLARVIEVLEKKLRLVTP